MRKVRLYLDSERPANDTRDVREPALSESILDAQAEEWHPVARCPLYEVSNFGRVRRVTYLATGRNESGYPTVEFWQRNKRIRGVLVHRLVAEAFVPNPSNLPIVHHKDHNRENPHVDNLEWTDNTENQRYSWARGVRENKRGSEHGNAKLTEHQVVCIRAFRKIWRQRAIAQHFGVSQHTIMYVHTGRGWSHIAGGEPPIKQVKLTPNDVRAIRRSPETNVALGKRYGVDQSTISQIRARKRWKDVV